MRLLLKYEKVSNILWLLASEVLYKIVIVYQWIKGNRYDVSFLELTKVMFFTNRFSLGLSQIERVSELKKYIKVYIKSISIPFYFPKRGYLTMLYIVGEKFSPTSWHFYEVKETPITKNDVVVDCGAGNDKVKIIPLAVGEKPGKIYMGGIYSGQARSTHMHLYLLKLQL